MTRLAGLILCGLVCIACPGCGYVFTTGYSAESSYDTSIKSVNVQIFENHTFYNGLGPQVASAVAQELRTRTPWAVTDSSTAQTTLTGTVTSLDLRRFSSRRGTGLVQEMAVELSVDFDWRDNRTGELIQSRRDFRVVETFVPTSVSGERLDAGRNRAVSTLAEDIARELRGDW